MSHFDKLFNKLFIIITYSLLILFCVTFSSYIMKLFVILQNQHIFFKVTFIFIAVHCSETSVLKWEWSIIAWTHCSFQQTYDR